jgi:hypothetical protein
VYFDYSPPLVDNHVISFGNNMRFGSLDKGQRELEKTAPEGKVGEIRGAVILLAMGLLSVVSLYTANLTVFLEMFMISQMVNKFLAFLGNRCCCKANHITDTIAGWALPRPFFFCIYNIPPPQY